MGHATKSRAFTYSVSGYRVVQMRGRSLRNCWCYVNRLITDNELARLRSICGVL